MTRRISRSLAALAMFALLGVTLRLNAADDPAGTAMRAAEQRWADLYNARDAAGLAKLYTRDAVRLPPDTSRVQGAEAIQAMLEKEVAGESGNYKFEVTDVHSSGNMGWVVGKWSIDMPGKQGGVVTQTGNYVSIYVKEADGAWRLALDTWHDKPSGKQ